MECPRRWAALLFLIQLIGNEVHVLCQCQIIGDPKWESCENPFSKSQLINTLYSLASTNAGLPDFGMPCQHTPLQELPLVTHQDAPKPISVVPLSHSSPHVSQFYQQEPIFISAQPTVSTVTCSNVVPASHSSFYPSIIPTQATCQPEHIENHAHYIQQASVWQMPQPTHEMCSHSPVQQISFAEPPAPLCSNPHPCQSCSILHPHLELNDCECGMRQEAVIGNQKQGLPVNLQINIPSPTTAPPTITVVSATPSPSSNPEPITYPVVGYHSPPVIISNSQSSLDRLLPIILIALLCDQDNAGCRCCNCKRNSDNVIPIPYPIPIPICTPVIHTAAQSSSGKDKKKSKDKDKSKESDKDKDKPIAKDKGKDIGKGKDKDDGKKE